ncbi:response regulator [Piscinibacter gummiphilus]|nr:response regulator [Piscinibacter gummiphilus]
MTSTGNVNRLRSQRSAMVLSMDGFSLRDSHESMRGAGSRGIRHGGRVAARLRPAHNDGLPAAGAGVPRSSLPVSPEPRAFTILVADDSEDAAESLAMLLEFEGHTVEVAHDGTSALVAAERLRPQVVVLDIGMPGLSGYEVATRLRATDWGRRVLIVAATGWGHDDDRRRALEAGFDRHLTKPMDATAFAASLGEWVDEAARRTGR